MDVTEVMLPGVGARDEFTAASGHQVGIVARRDGEFDVICFRRSDPDAADTLFTLDRQQAEALADILGAPRIVERFADLSREVPGLASETIDLPKGSRFDGRTLGENGAHRHRVSVVAVVREDGVIPAPAPDEVLLGGCSLVVIGTGQGIERARGVLLG